MLNDRERSSIFWIWFVVFTFVVHIQNYVFIGKVEINRQHVIKDHITEENLCHIFKICFDANSNTIGYDKGVSSKNTSHKKFSNIFKILIPMISCCRVFNTYGYFVL